MTYNLSDFQESARTYRSELLRLPILSIASALAYMQPRMGVRYEERVGSADIDIELQPYRKNNIQDTDLDVNLRTLRTYFGSVNAEFDPNAAISTIMGHRAFQASGDQLATTPQALEILALTPKAIGAKLLRALFCARHNPYGTKTTDLFDGFDTITEREIDDGNISVARGNLLELDGPFDDVNAYQITQRIVDAMSPELRETECIMYCSQKFADAYNRSYRLEAGAVPYNTEFGKTTVEGTDGRLRIVPFVGKADSDFIHICPAANMLVGMDQMSDLESVRVGDYKPDTFTVMLRMFFGTEFESIDPRRFLAVKLKK